MIFCNLDYHKCIVVVSFEKIINNKFRIFCQIYKKNIKSNVRLIIESNKFLKIQLNFKF